eukprot:TRINITY_DN2995_c0_g1_i2.p1 TRINITY_DN2995_c0_g1~~TRINITY_DN2995_c0_g1_i2.p1  ORF type:complete len:358 (-),score=67.60 TRINITY_DN2995_c0_g1_i2:91-1164(-)
MFPFHFTLRCRCTSKYVPYLNTPIRSQDWERFRVDRLGHKLGVKHLDDWYQFGSVEFEKESRLMTKYQHSPYQVLKNVYPHHKWRPWSFKGVPRNFWRDRSNQKMFVDDLENELGIKSKEDWYHVSRKEVMARGGGTMLDLYFGGSLFKLLTSFYPHHDWIQWKFSRVENKFWTKMRDYRKLIHYLSDSLKINQIEDWYHVSIKQIQERIPLTVFQTTSLSAMLQEAYPDHLWDKKRLEWSKTSKGAAQRDLLLCVQELFPGSEVRENFFSLENDNFPLQLDLHLPIERLAFEYQGEQHFQDIYSVSTRKRQEMRDERKKKICKEKGITLIEVPYWWKGDKAAVIEAIRSVREDLTF